MEKDCACLQNSQSHNHFPIYDILLSVCAAVATIRRLLFGEMQVNNFIQTEPTFQKIYLQIFLPNTFGMDLSENLTFQKVSTIR